MKNYPLWLSIRETNCTIQWIEIYLAALDSIIHLLNTWSLVPVVQKLDSTIHGINLYPEDKYQENQLHYPVDRDLSDGYSAIHRISSMKTNCVIHWIVIYPCSGQGYPPFEKLGPVGQRYPLHVLMGLITSNFITFSCLFTAANMTAV